MGLPKLFGRRSSNTQPPGSPSGTSSRTSRGRSLGKKLLIAQKLFPSKQIPSSETQKSPRSPIMRRCRSASSASSVHQDGDLEDVFKKFDRNGDGKISSGELADMMRCLGTVASDEECEKMVRQADCDGDGFIDYQEFVQLNTKGVDSAGSLKALKEAFDIYDKDRNGSITSEELYMVMRELHMNSSIEECKNMIKGVDCDGDGCVNFEEFKIMMTSSA